MLVKGAVRTNPVAERNMNVEMTNDHDAPESSGGSHVTTRSATEWEALLAGDVLKRTSRSFYITLQLLPKGVRGPICLGYLLARTSDTIADTETVPATERVPFLHRFHECVRTLEGSEALKADLVERFQPLQTDEAEKVLLGHTHDSMQWLGAANPFDREAVRTVLDDILHGQRLDCQRFGEPGELRFLNNDDELEEYTYLVAGSVGLFWTRLCFHHVRKFSSESQEQMEIWGKAYGRALQLINILRDLPKDLENGRCYFPKSEVGDTLPPTPEILMDVSAKWERRCEDQLGDALLYCMAMKPARLRYATALPLLLAIRTLALLRRADWKARSHEVKVSRNEVKSIMRRALVAQLSTKRLASLATKLKEEI